LTAAAYALAAVLCCCAFVRVNRSVRHEHQRRTFFWLILAALFALLAINKQLDLQSWFTGVGREIARRGGWYEQRQAVQTIFVIVLALVGVGLIAWLAWFTRRHWREYGLAVVGSAFIIVFIIIRAASFHHVDRLLSFEPWGARMNWVFELGGIACVALAAAINCKVRR
jgi:hypothetical protein